VTPAETDRQDKLQHHRLRMTLVSVVNHALLTLVIGLYAGAGEVPWSAVWLFGLVGIGQAGVFALAIHRGWNLRFADAALMAPQFYTAVAVQLGGLILVPQLWVLFLAGVLVIYIFGMMGFSARQFTVAWITVGLGVAGALMLSTGRLGHLGRTPVSAAILALYFYLIIQQLTVFGKRITSLRHRLTEQNRQLAESLQRIHQLASHDDLTGVLNRRAFMQLLADERSRALRTGQPFAVALLDIDHFKSVNDRFGHLTGDAVLKEFCRVVGGAGIRSTDRLGRFGGEEFILLLVPVAGGDAAFVATERVRLAVQAHDWERIMPGLKLSTSAGVAAFAPADTVERLIARADQALYAAKGGGRNRTEIG
jgi:diguanylate cyclase (GGDEF)-like protein